MSTYCQKYKCNTLQSTYNYPNSKPVSVNSSGGIAMKKKYANKFSPISANSKFSINNTNNSISNYIGNSNTSIAYTHCKEYDTNTKTSVKNYSGYMQTRIVNNSIKANSNISYKCYKDNNSELIASYENNKPLNKHLTTNNKDHSSRTQLLKSRCYIDRTNNRDLSISNNANATKCDYKKLQKCNITKDDNTINGYTPGYGLYYNTSLFKKKCTININNPPDAKIIAC